MGQKQREGLCKAVKVGFLIKSTAMLVGLVWRVKSEEVEVWRGYFWQLHTNLLQSPCYLFLYAMWQSLSYHQLFFPSPHATPHAVSHQRTSFSHSFLLVFLPISSNYSFINGLPLISGCLPLLQYSIIFSSAFNLVKYFHYTIYSPIHSPFYFFESTLRFNSTPNRLFFHGRTPYP